jgi:hypothetical protein
MQDQANTPGLADDLLDGGAAICKELYGSATRADLRRLYYQASQLPVFQLDNSGRFHALKSRLRAHLEAKSAQSEARIAAAAAEAAAEAAAKAAAKSPRRRRRSRPNKAA